jgi:hypothetical protein
MRITILFGAREALFCGTFLPGTPFCAPTCVLFFVLRRAILIFVRVMCYGKRRFVVKVKLEVAENKIEVGNFCAANHMRSFDKIRNNFCLDHISSRQLPLTLVRTAHEDVVYGQETKGR